MTFSIRYTGRVFKGSFVKPSFQFLKRWGLILAAIALFALLVEGLVRLVLNPFDIRLIPYLPWFHCRPLGYLLFFLALALSLTFTRLHKLKLVIGFWIAFLLWPLCPVDFSLYYFPGPPHFVPLGMGMPSDVAWKRAEHGEILFGGCITNGYEPKWVLVW
jgi:hypothetical protein